MLLGRSHDHLARGVVLFHVAMGLRKLVKREDAIQVCWIAAGRDAIHDLLKRLRAMRRVNRRPAGIGR